MAVAIKRMEHTTAVLHCYTTQWAEVANARRLLALASVLDSHKCEDGSGHPNPRLVSIPLTLSDGMAMLLS